MGNLYTIGHSTLKLDDFFQLLHIHNINYVLDVRSIPYSKYANQFDREILSSFLRHKKIHYVYMGTHFGARQENQALYDQDGILDFEKVRADDAFQIRIKNVEKGLTEGYNIALMCSEKDPFNCHRAIMVARGFELDNIKVNHILHDGTLLSQNDLNERLLNFFFPNRNQLCLEIDGASELNNTDYLVEAYRKRNKQIGYHLLSNYEDVV